MLSWVFANRKTGAKRRKAPPGKRPPYEQAKKIAAGGDVPARSALARREDLKPELLYYFATDESPEVRRSVAENPGTPLQADSVLAGDVDDEVRCEVARKIGRLVPALSDDEKDRLTVMALQILEVLAADHLPQVRAIVAQALKSASNVPHHLIMRLAKDVEEIVSAPVVEYSPLLSAEDLLEIIASGVGEGTLAALSRREHLVDSVVRAVVKLNSKQSMKALLENHTAEIDEDALDAIAAVATGAVDLHRPIVDRKNLSLRMIRRIATFVSAALVDKLIERNNLNVEVGDELRVAVRRRIHRDDFSEPEPERDPADQRATKMFEEGTLDDAVIEEAIDNFDRGFVRYALMLLAGVPPEVVLKVLESGSGKAVTALAWKAGLSMRTAETLQTRVARIQPKSMIKAREGDAFPMNEEDLNWYLELFTG